MGKSPGKWLKTVLLGKKSSRSRVSKGRDGSKAGNVKETRITATVPSADLVVSPPIVSQPASGTNHNQGGNSELDKGTTPTLQCNEAVSLPQDTENQEQALSSQGGLDVPKQYKSATKVQAAFRGYLARRAFCALRGIIRLQALVRGHLVRRQARATLRCMQGIVKLQALVRGQKVKLSDGRIEVSKKSSLRKPLRYDPDPAAKAAAASVLASKLGADWGLKFNLGDETKVDPASGKSRDVELAQSKGLRNRHNRSNSTGTLALNQSAEEVPDNVGPGGSEPATHNQVVVDHHPNSTVQDGGWVARIAALLVGEDPTQSYALICGNCHMHNGLARKEDFAYITYYCPHCHALNKSKQLEESGASVANSSNASIPDTPNSGEVTITPTTSNLINKNLSAVVETLAGEIDEKVTEEPHSS